MADCVALIVASGRGQRFGGACPKQYQPLAGRPVLRHCLERLRGHPRIAAVRVVIHPADRALYDAAASASTCSSRPRADRPGRNRCASGSRA